MPRTPRPRKVTPAQLERIREQARLNANKAASRLAPPAEPVRIARQPRRRKGR